MTLVALVGAFLVSAGLVIYLAYGGREVTVPDLVGKSQADAEKELSSSGLRLRITHSAPSGKVAADLISEQSPAAGATVKTGQSVRVIISAGAPPASASPTPGASAAASPRPDATKSPTPKPKPDAGRDKEKDKDARANSKDTSVSSDKSTDKNTDKNKDKGKTDKSDKQDKSSPGKKEDKPAPGQKPRPGERI